MLHFDLITLIGGLVLAFALIVLAVAAYTAMVPDIPFGWTRPTHVQSGASSLRAAYRVFLAGNNLTPAALTICRVLGVSMPHELHSTPDRIRRTVYVIRGKDVSLPYVALLADLHPELAASGSPRPWRDPAASVRRPTRRLPV